MAADYEDPVPEDWRCAVCNLVPSEGEFRRHVRGCVADLRASRDNVLTACAQARRERDEAVAHPLVRSAEPSRPVLTPQQKTAAREEMKAQGGPCLHCGGLHSRACPRVKRVKWDGGKPVEAEYWRDGKWPTDSILFPDDIAEDDEDEEGAL